MPSHPWSSWKPIDRMVLSSTDRDECYLIFAEKRQNLLNSSLHTLKASLILRKLETYLLEILLCSWSNISQI